MNNCYSQLTGKLANGYRAYVWYVEILAFILPSFNELIKVWMIFSLNAFQTTVHYDTKNFFFQGFENFIFKVVLIGVWYCDVSGSVYLWAGDSLF